MSELEACGLNRQAIAVRVANGRLHPKHCGVYAVGHPSLTLEGEFLAAVKACGPDAFLSNYSSAALDGYVRWDGRRIEVTVADGSHREHEGIRIHRTIALPPQDRRRVKGIPTTAPARTLIDLAATLDARSLRRAVRQAQATHRVNIRELAEVLTRFQRRAGRSRLAQLVLDGPTPTRSELEDIVLDLILQGGFARPDVNEPLYLDGRKVVPDFRWPAEHLVIEADSRAWHSGDLAKEDDAERQALLESFGEHVLRVTWSQTITKPTQTRARIRAAGAPGR